MQKRLSFWAFVGGKKFWFCLWLCLLLISSFGHSGELVDVQSLEALISTENEATKEEKENIQSATTSDSAENNSTNNTTLKEEDASIATLPDPVEESNESTENFSGGLEVKKEEISNGTPAIEPSVSSEDAKDAVIGDGIGVSDAGEEVKESAKETGAEKEEALDATLSVEALDPSEETKDFESIKTQDTPSVIAPETLSSVPEEEKIRKELLPTAKMRTETIYLVRFLEDLHFVNKKIGQIDQKKVVEDYLNSLDANRMLLTQDDVDRAVKRFAPSMELLLKGGSLMPAFTMFSEYYEKASKRLNWVVKRLEEPFCFDAPDDIFRPDRKDAPWPKDEKEADLLWESRLRYELLNEMLANKPKKETKKSAVKSDDVEEDVPPNLENALKNIPESVNQLRDRYKHFKGFLSKIDETEIQELFLNVLCHMYDPHTGFFSVDSMEDFSIMLHNSLVGIGAYLRDDNGYCIIEQLHPGGPAESSKQIKPGDKILAVGQDKEEPVNIFGLKLRQTVKLLRGPKGTKVKLILQPVDGNPSDRKEVILIRDEIKLVNNLASAKLYNFAGDDRRVNKIGYIDLPAFYGDDDNAKQNTTDDVKKLIHELRRLGMEILVFDLRRNGGGLLTEAIRLTGLFLEECPVVQVKDTGGKIEKFFAPPCDAEWTGPLIMLVSRFSASASEIVAGALKNHRRALVVGDPHTHGKGSVQALIEMDRLSFLPRKTPYLGSAKITIQKWYLPDGSSTQQKGVSADIPLPSFNETLPLGESNTPNSLPWDSIATLPWSPLKYKNKYTFMDPDLIDKLRKNSIERQSKLEEFKILNEKITYLKDKYGQNEYSLNLPRRVNDLAADKSVRKSIESKFKTIAKNKYAFQAVTLFPSNVPKPKELEESISEELSPEEFDVFERESVRIASDWLNLRKQKTENDLTASSPQGAINFK